MPFCLQSSTLQAVLQLLAVQSEYANLTAPHDHDPDPPPYSTQCQSPSVSPLLTQTPPVEYKSLIHTTSGQSSGQSGPPDRPLTDAISSEAVASKITCIEPVVTYGSSILEQLNVDPSVTKTIPTIEKNNTTGVPASTGQFTHYKSPINPVSSPNQLIPAVANSSSNITSTDPIMSLSPSPSGSLLGLDKSFPEITHSQAEGTPLPEPQLAVSTGSPYVKTIHCLSYIYTQLNVLLTLLHGILHGSSTLPRELTYSEVFFQLTMLWLVSLACWSCI